MPTAEVVDRGRLLTPGARDVFARMAERVMAQPATKVYDVGEGALS